MDRSRSCAQHVDDGHGRGGSTGSEMGRRRVPLSDLALFLSTRIMKLHLVICTLLASTTPALAGGVSVFVGPLGGAGSVRIRNEGPGATTQEPPALQNIRLLPVDFVGRTSLEDPSSDHPRLVSDVPNASRVRLPLFQGSIYRFVRAEGMNEAVYGFFAVGANGAAASLLELPPAPDGSDPFLDHVAVSPDGAAILVATTLAAGGDVHELDLSSGADIDHTADRAPLDFGSEGLSLRASWGAAVHAGGILRFARGSSAPAEDVGFGALTAPNWFAREIIASPNGDWAATIAGDDELHSYPFVFGASGPAARMSIDAAALSGAGSLPGALDGPWLAVSDSGRICAWRTGRDPIGSKELWITTAPPAEGGVPQHITRDQLFDPTLDEVGLFIFTPVGHFLFAAGDPGVAGQTLLRRSDVFRASFGPGGIGLLDLSRNSGNGLPPFLGYGELDLECALWVAGPQSLLVLAREPSQGYLLEIDSDDNRTDERLDDITDLDLVEEAGGDLLLSITSSHHPQDQGLFRLPASLGTDAQLVLGLAPGARILRSASAPDGSFAFITQNGTDELLRRRTPGGEFRLLSPLPALFGPSLGFTDSGGVALSAAAHSGLLFANWTEPGILRRLWTESAGGCVLAGM